MNIGNETENGIGYGPDKPEYMAWQEKEICLFPTTTFAQGKRDVNLTTHLHLVPSLKMSRAVTTFLYILSCHGPKLYPFLTGSYLLFLV